MGTVLVAFITGVVIVEAFVKISLDLVPLEFFRDACGSFGVALRS
jgi:hypothetical protein